MLAEQLATQLSKTGRIGIAKMIEKAHGPTGAMTLAAPHAALDAPQAALAAPHAALAAPHSEAVPSGPAAVDPVPLDAAEFR